MERIFGEHTVKSFDEHFKNISAIIKKMAALSAESIAIVEEAIVKKSDLITKIEEHDRNINKCDNEIENEVVVFIALRQPKAYDLRFSVSAIKVSSNLERVGDYAKSVVKKLAKINNISSNHAKLLLKMTKISKEMVEEAVDSLVNNNLEESKRVLDKDHKIDAIYQEIINEFNKEQLSENSRDLVEVLFIAKSIERLADHAFNIAAIVNYTVTGKTISS